MLNELIAIERGLRAAGQEVGFRHPDVKSVGKKDLVLVRLGEDGSVVEIELLDRDAATKLWTIRDGQHNSFPFVQIKRPLLRVPNSSDLSWWEPFQAHRESNDLATRRQVIVDLARSYAKSGQLTADWPAWGLLRRLEERLAQLDALQNSDAAAVPSAIVRFLTVSKDTGRLVRAIVNALADELQEGTDRWIEAGQKLLLESGALYFDVARNDFPRDVSDPRQIEPVSEALTGAASKDAVAGRCALSGKTAELISDRFPQPNLPTLGQTYLFSKNKDIPATGRYGRIGPQAFAVGQKVAARLASALETITNERWQGKAWRTVPGERPAQFDLLIAFVEIAPDVAITATLADEGGDATGSRDDHAGNSPSAFRRRTERVIQAVKAKAGDDFTRTPVQICLLRRVDPANRKVIYHRALTVGQLHAAVTDWHDGECNFPEWLAMWVPGAKGGKAVLRYPPHVAPTRLPELTRRQYVQDGTRRTEVVGLSWPHAFALFLNDPTDRQGNLRALQLILRRHGGLLSGTSHAIHKALDHDKHIDRRPEALQSVSIIGVLIHKLGRNTEKYMDDAAFKLGQLLAAVDEIHVGYCMEMRSGSVPPTLLGNAVLPMAQSDPVKALSLLCRRWKPYAAWVKRVDVSKANHWTVRRAASVARRVKSLSHDLHGSLGSVQRVDDVFRAELLLGYISGLPKAKDDAPNGTDAATQVE